MNHFMHCSSYKRELCWDWNDIFGNNIDKQVYAWLAIEKRFSEREDMMTKQEDGCA